MKILVITNLYPNACQPGRSAFNQQQIERLAKRCEVKVVAPLPWVPKGFLKSSAVENAPEREMINGVDVYHPRYLVTPKIGRALYGWFLYAAIAELVKKIERDFPFDAIFATWAYPDCFAASEISKRRNKPLVCKVHGSDINIIAQYPLRRRMIRSAFQRAASVVCVTEDLKKKIQAMGIASDKLVLIPNGVDKNKFKIHDRVSARATLGLPEGRRYILFIGNLTPVKGLKYLIEAIRQMDHHTELIILGDGALQTSMENMTVDFHLQEQIKFLGRKPHQDVVNWMNAADVLCLPSLQEGCPNVILEAMACGLPIVASDTGGIPALIVSDELGFLVPVKDTETLAKRLKQALEKIWNRAKIAAHAEAFDWDAGVEKIEDLLQQAVHHHER